MSFIDPVDEERKGLQQQLMEVSERIQKRAEQMARKHNVAPSQDEMMMMRLEAILDHFLPAFLDDLPHSPEEPPTNIERLRFEVDFQTVIAERLDVTWKDLERGRIQSAAPQRQAPAPGLEIVRDMPQGM